MMIPDFVGMKTVTEGGGGGGGGGGGDGGGGGGGDGGVPPCPLTLNERWVTLPLRS